MQIRMSGLKQLFLAVLVQGFLISSILSVFEIHFTHSIVVKFCTTMMISSAMLMGQSFIGLVTRLTMLRLNWSYRTCVGFGRALGLALAFVTIEFFVFMPPHLLSQNGVGYAVWAAALMDYSFDWVSSIYHLDLILPWLFHKRVVDPTEEARGSRPPLVVFHFIRNARNEGDDGEQGEEGSEGSDQDGEWASSTISAGPGLVT